MRPDEEQEDRNQNRMLSLMPLRFRTMSISRRSSSVLNFQPTMCGGRRLKSWSTPEAMEIEIVRT